MSLLAIPSPSPTDVPPPLLDNVPPDTPPTRISAYYSLVFPNITFYLQTLTVTIGRRCIPPPSAHANATDSIPSSNSVDVDLGPLKSVSRLHARIEYEEEEERFVLVVIGRNGAWVDGVWSGASCRVPLGERSQIQIASRTFHFVLPPPPAPEDSPSPSSISSVHRARSPSVDITSISPPSSLPSHSPSPRSAPALPPLKPPRSPEPQLPNSNAIPRSKLASTSTPASTSNLPSTSTGPTSKKRKKPSNPPPKPDVMPPKPQLTYAQLCHRAIKGMGGKATLQDICGWMMDNYDWYRYNEGAGWENSVRHNLSSGRAFKKMERSTGEHGKGFFWSVDEQHEHIFEEQEARALAQAQAQSATPSSLPSAGGKDGSAKGSRKKEKAIPLDPPLKRSVKSGIGPLPPPLTSTPLVFPSKSTSDSPAPPSGQPVGGLGRAQALAGPFTTVPRVIAASAGTAIQATKSEPTEPPRITPDLVWGSHASTSSAAPVTNLPTSAISSSLVTLSVPASPAAVSSSASASPLAALPPSVCLPIIVGPVPPSHPSSGTLDPPPIVLHNNILVLSPAIFSSLTPEQLVALEEMGAQKALEVLQGHIVRYLKERIGKKKRKKATSSAEKGATKSGKSDVPERSSPFTTVPLPPRTTQTTPYPPTQPSTAPHPLSQPPASAAGLSNMSDFCATLTKSFVPNTVEAKESVPSPVDSRPPVPVPIKGVGRSETPNIVIDEDVEEERVAKRRKLGNNTEPDAQLKLDTDATRGLQIVDEDIEVDVC